MMKLAKIEIEVTEPEGCPHAKVYRDYCTHETSRIICIYPYIRTVNEVDLQHIMPCRWYTGVPESCPLEDIE